MSVSNSWVVPLPDSKEGAFRVFCLPYAGGSAANYRTWVGAVSPVIQLFAIELPGRGKRIHEPLATDLDMIVADLAQALLPLLDRPYAILGHSMGGAIGLRLTRYLQELDVRLPDRLVIMGHAPPHLPPRSEVLHRMSDEELVEKLRSFDGTPEEVLKHPELMRLMLPIVRADFQMLETQLPDPGRPIPCSLTVLAGRDDAEAPPLALEEWHTYTDGTFSLRIYPGKHFFPWSCTRSIARDLEDDLLGR